jgi:signal transduction histidine kinase
MWWHKSGYPRAYLDVRAILSILVSNPGEFPVLIIGAAVILVGHAALVTALICQRRRTRRIEERLECREAELRSSYERIRDIGGRLLTAQEAERSRIARELHDDIGQQLALLRFDLHQMNGHSEAVGRLDELAMSVHDLSHRLHPARLQHLGLVASLRALACEHSRTGTVVSFTHGDIPDDLSPALSLCLFRVVQESLGNAAKYGQAANVLVDLHRDASSLALTIIDDGVGFELESAWGKGLGLVSIRERVEASGGTVAISSKPKRGTRFDVRVPLAVEPARWARTEQVVPSVVVTGKRCESSTMSRAALVSVATQRSTSARQPACERSIQGSAIFAEF